MSTRRTESHTRGSIQKSSLHEKVATLFYSIGLLCSSYPTTVLVFAIVVIISCCVPLANIPFSLTSPKQEWISTINLTNTIVHPFCYVQQVTLKIAVLPWEADLTLGDGFRAPLYESFKVLDIVRNYQDNSSLKTLGHLCLHVEAVSKHTLEPSLMPQYSCLVLSPSNFWQQDVNQFSQDSTILTTIFNQHIYHKGKVSMAEILFGMPLRDTGIKRYPIRHRQRVIQFAVTLFFKDFDKEFIEGLQAKLTSVYPLHQNHTRTQTALLNDTLVINYPEEFGYIELAPVVAAFIVLFFSYYFYVRKVDDIKSKAGMSFAAMITVLCSLLMTMGICFIFGLNVNNQKEKWVFPYLVILFGFENVLVLTKSVLITDLHLDAKIRLAQGLSKEGWSTTKNLLIEITVFTFGLFTFVPVIQELCIFALINLITSLFLQIFFFSTILGVDLNRASTTIEKTKQSFRNALYQPLTYSPNITFTSKGMIRSRSHPRLNFPANVVAGQKHSNNQEKKISKRLKVMTVWARTRLFQRFFMFWMMVWICMIIYNSDIINNYFLNVNEVKQNSTGAQQFTKNYLNLNFFPQTNSTRIINYVTYNPLDLLTSNENRSFDLEKLKPSEYAPWLKLSYNHWSGILRKYNVSLSGKSIAILPSIKLSHVISPEQAVLLRNPEEKYGNKLQWQALAAALDPIDFNGDDFPTIDQIDQPLYPRSPMEIMLLSILILISIAVVTYGIVVLYKCVCSRNYAEWRASWYSEKHEEPIDEQVMLEAVPVVLDGHAQEVECIATDGAHLASICLGGLLKIWDNSTGDVVAILDRKAHFQAQNPSDSNLDNENDLSDYESGSPPSRDEVFPTLIHRIDTNFSNLRSRVKNPDSDSKTLFRKSYRHYYCKPNENVWFFRHRRLSSSDKFNNFKKTTECTLGSSKVSSVWCMDFVNNLIIIGCSDGKLEFWEATSSKLKCIYEDGSQYGVTNVKLIGSKVIAARLCGSIDFLQLQSFNQGRPVDWNFTCAYRRTHIRTGSMGSSLTERDTSQQFSEDLRCVKMLNAKAHQQPITCLDCEGGRIITGSQDHTLKVHRVENGELLYSLHGHCGPITCLFIDRIHPATFGSGSQDGMLCVWDLISGACMYNIQAHDGSITSLAYSASYVISLGVDERLCVWERFQGHLLNTILVGHVFSNDVLMLTSHLAVTGRNGGLVIWDVRNGDCVRTITLGRDPFVFIKQLILLRDAILCDYGKQLRIVKFPLITHKYD
ncbi:hypothetical protein ABEB36_002893 [Hypothenemus hampei]|uniref:Sterol regulatory element-binding protein cleavage-activating protein n=1 Tax=Hypothenemus hampei TaxID=57062 RepID=A0ABD1F7B5_HYPHA